MTNDKDKNEVINIRFSTRIDILAIILLSLGLSVLPFAAKWLLFKNYFPIILIIVSFALLLISKVYKRKLHFNKIDINSEKLLEAREQLIDIIVKRTQRFAIVIFILGFVGIAGYLQASYGNQLRNLKNTEKLLIESDSTHKKLLSQFHNMNELYENSRTSSKQIRELEQLLSVEANRLQAKIALISESIPLETRQKEILMNRQEIIDKEFAKRENRHYIITLHCKLKYPKVDKLKSILSKEGFKVELHKIEESEKLPYKNRLYYYSEYDKDKSLQIIDILKINNIPIEAKFDELVNLQREFHIWLE